MVLGAGWIHEQLWNSICIPPLAGHFWLTWPKQNSLEVGISSCRVLRFCICFLSSERKVIAEVGGLSDGSVLMPAQYAVVSLKQGELSACSGWGFLGLQGC